MDFQANRRVIEIRKARNENIKISPETMHPPAVIIRTHINTPNRREAISTKKIVGVSVLIVSKNMAELSQVKTVAQKKYLFFDYIQKISNENKIHSQLPCAVLDFESGAY